MLFLCRAQVTAHCPSATEVSEEDLLEEYGLVSMGPACCHLPEARRLPHLSTALRRGHIPMGSTRTLELPCCGPQQLCAGWKTLRKAAGIPAPASKGEGGARASGAGVIAGVRVGPEGHVVRQVRVWAGWDPRPALNTVSMERGRPCSNHHGPGRRGARRWHTPLLSRGSWQRG